MGLAVSFNECFKGDTRCNASNISRKTIRSGEILKLIMQAMFSYPALSRLKAKEFFRLFHETLLKRRGHIN